MKQLIPLIFLFIASALCGQEAAAVRLVEQATTLQEAGILLLQNENNEVFKKAMALGKFRGSQRVLDSLNDDQNELRKNNVLQIRQLIIFFSSNKNSDSLLRTTRFYPDSIFKTDKRYSDRLKILIPQFLDQFKRKKRDDFFNIENLNYTSETDRSDNIGHVLEFEKYWPFEVMEFEKELQQKENDLQGISQKNKDDFLYSFFKNELNEIKNQIKIDSLVQNVQYMRQKKESTESELEIAQQYASQLKKIGIAIIALLLLGGFYGLQKSRQLLNSMNQTVLEEKKRSEELLHNMLPPEVARELKNKAAARAHKYELVSVLFSDFQNFSQIAKTLSPEELVMELDYCFTAFDRIVDKYRLQKIKTIGDAYMCVGGLYTKGTSHVARMAMAALEIQAFLNNLKKRREAEGKHFFQARIGIHTGPIVAGVVGTKKFAFDIWGDTVNTAQQMEYHSEPGRVNITGETYELIKAQFKCTFRSKAVIKNMKAFDMYFVDGLVREPKSAS